MDRPYHITVFDNFHPHDPDEAWVSGTFATADAAIAAVRRKIDTELEYLWSEVCDQDKGFSTLERLVSQYNSFAEMPVAFDRNGQVIFDSRAYMAARAAEVVTQTPAPYGLTAEPVLLQQQPPVPKPTPPPHRLPRLRAAWALFNEPQAPRVLLFAFLVLCLLIGLFNRVAR